MIKTLFVLIGEKLLSLKSKALEYWSGNKNEFFEKVKDKAVEIIKSKI